MKFRNVFVSWSGNLFCSLAIVILSLLVASGGASAANFAHEEVASSYGYRSGYAPKPISEQVNRLRELFPELGTADIALASQPLPERAEGWFAVPRWEKIAPTYNKAIEKILAKLSETRNGKFSNFRHGRLGPQYLRQHERTVAMWKKLGKQQAGQDILVVAAQFGLEHRGRSVRRAREMFNEREFGLSAFAVGIMLLTHPERLRHDDDLWIDSAGDEYARYGDGGFSDAPIFNFDDGEVEFNLRWFAYARERYGSASAFLPAEAR